jgi:hypothetical protein
MMMIMMIAMMVITIIYDGDDLEDINSIMII